jgi:hypothetical protein
MAVGTKGTTWRRGGFGLWLQLAVLATKPVVDVTRSSASLLLIHGIWVLL